MLKYFEKSNFKRYKQAFTSNTVNFIQGHFIQ